MTPRRLLLSIAVAGALQFAGCLAPPVDPGVLEDHGDPVLLTARPVAWDAPVEVGLAGYEPALAIDDAGTLFLTAHKDLDRPLTWTGLGSPLLVSRDGGATWEPTASPLGLHGGFAGVEGDLAVDATGRLFFLDTYAADNHLHVFDNEGRAWAYSVPAQRTLGADDRPWVAAQGDGIVHYLGNNGVSVNGGRIWYYRSTDGGLTFSPGLPVPGDGWAHIAAERHGTRVYVAQEAFGGGASGPITLLASNDSGATWSDPELVGWRNGFGRGYPIVDATDDGYAYVLFNDCGTAANCGADGGHMPNRLHISLTWDGSYWIQREVTPAWNGFADYATLCAAPGGRVGLAFYGTPDTPVTPESEWFVYGAIATEVDVDLRFRFHLTKADPTPVYVGDDLHALHDFLECAITPDGDLAVAYQRTHGAHSEDGIRDVWFARGGLE